MLRVLLVGVGRWGTNHLRVLHSLPVELYVADISDDHLNRARAIGIPGSRMSTDPFAFMPRIDAAAVVVPGPAQAQLCRTFLDANKDVFVEKPPALDALEAKQLANLADARGCIFQVGHVFRFDPASRWLQKAIARGDFGRLRMLRGRFSGFKRPRTDMGVAFADAVHFVDLFNYFVGRAPTRVTAVMRDFLGRGLEDDALISLDYEPDPDRTEVGATDPKRQQDGAVWATVEAGYHTPGKQREVLVVGEALTALCDYNVAQYKVTTYRNEHVVKGEEIVATEGEVRRLEFPPEEPLLAEWRAFITSVEKRVPPLSDGWAGYDAVRVIAAAVESARTGHAIQLERGPREMQRARHGVPGGSAVARDASHAPAAGPVACESAGFATASSAARRL